MFQNYIKIALRNLAKNKLYAAINVFGLAIGLTVYLFGGILADYEIKHDTRWQDNDRIYYVGSYLSPNANIGIKQLDTTFSALGPLFKENISEVEYMARTIRRSYLVSTEDKKFNETIRFADADLLKIFNFTYLEGDSSALEDPSGVVLTRAQAMKMFGRTDIKGEVLQLNNEHQLNIQAVIEDMPLDTHFVSNLIMNEPFNIIVSLKSLETIANWEANYYNTSSGNYIYLKLLEPMPLDELSDKLTTIHIANTPEEQRERFMRALFAKNITMANTGIWDMIGMPAIQSIQILGLLVLVIAIVNYTNLATAQSLGRTREVGMRKTLGASRSQLMFQFLTESITIAFISMLLAVVFLEMLTPLFNSAMGKIMALNYLELLPYLITTAVVVGLVAGAYPSYLITKTNSIDALKGTTVKGSKGGVIRSLMIGVQFMLSIFMLGMVLIVFFQNQKVQDSSNIFPKDEILTLSQLNKQPIREREDTLRIELEKLEHVKFASFTTHIPFDQSNSTQSIFLEEGKAEPDLHINQIVTDHRFLPVFDIPLLAGRNFSAENLGDYRAADEDTDTTVIINELAREMLGFETNEDALGVSFYGSADDEGNAFRYEIIGVVATQNILGLHNDIKPYMFRWEFWPRFNGAIRIAKGAPTSVIDDIERVWDEVNPEYPIEHQFLSAVFQQIYRIFETMNAVLAGFAAVALTLALIGLFGLAAFMARTRTKEIGIRKVLGADIAHLVRMMLWQFSKPVMWAILIALPLAYLTSGTYLEFFQDRLELSIQIPLIIFGGMAAVALSWTVIALHAIKVARSNPIVALHYE